jgi:hypothetical protein
MKIVSALSFSFILLVFSAIVSAQEEDKKLEDIFGRPFRNPCIVGTGSGKVRFCQGYNFNGEYAIGVGTGEDRTVLKVNLTPKSYIEEMDRPISADERRDFLEKAARIRPYGSLRASGKTSMKWAFDSDSWEIYDNAYIAYSHTKLGLTAIMVYFTFDVSGHVFSAEKFALGGKDNSLIKVNIDGSTYLTTDESYKIDSICTLKVVNP